MKKFILIICLVVFNQNIFGQQNKAIDSLVHLATIAKHDSIRLNIYIEICVICEIKDNLKYGLITNSIADKLIAKSKSNSEKENYIRKKLMAYKVIGIYYDEREELDSLERYKIKSLELAKTTNNQDLVNEQIDNLVEMYRRENEYTKAMNVHTDYLKEAEKENDKKSIIFNIRGISNTYGRLHNNKKALEYKLKELKLVEEEGDPSSIAWTNLYVGQCYYNLYDYKTAINYYLKAEKYYDTKVEDGKKIYLYFSIARPYNELKQFKEARSYFLKALEINKKSHKYPGDSVVRGVFHSEIGQTYFYEKNYIKALEYKLQGIALINNKSDGDAFLPHLTTGEVYLALKQYDLAEKNVLIAKKIAEGRKDIHNQKASIRTLSSIYKAKGNTAKANELLVTYYQLKDSMDKLANAEELLYKELNYENEKKEAQLKAEQDKQNSIYSIEKKKQMLIIYSVTIGLLLTSVFAIFVVFGLRKTRQANMIISRQKSEVELQKHLVEEKQKEITDSISYAKRLQEAILPPNEFVNKHVPANFILYKPKDIVAGDFYWAEKVGELFFIAAADSTGHGVPGAMVSVVCSNALNRSIKEFKLTETGKILDKTRELVIETFEKSTSEVKDGMDISLLCLDSKNKKVFWSGANNPLWYIQANEILEIKADKQAIGKSDNAKPFTTHQIEYLENTLFYLFTDGLADQFGGPRGKKFKYKQLEELLVSISNRSMQEQSNIILQSFEDWKGSLEQVDDVCVIGIKV